MAGRLKRVGPDTRLLYTLLQGPVPPMQLKDIEGLIDSSENFGFVFNKLLYLPPLSLKGDFIPLLQMRCHLRNTPPRLNLRVGMVRPAPSESDENAKKEYHILGVGFRFETTHPGTHHYNHMQICIKPFDKERFNRIWKCPDWLPQSWPAVQTFACNAVELFLNMLVGFYGDETLDIVSGVGFDKIFTRPLRILNL